MMGTRTRTLALLLLLPLLAFVGCSKDSSPVDPSQGTTLTAEETQNLSDDFASTLADPTEGMLPLWMDFDGAVGMVATPNPKDGAASVSDTTIRSNDFFTFTRIRNFYDADGNRSDSYDSLTTVALERIMTMTGEHVSPRVDRTVSIDHYDSTYVDGIAPDDTLRTLNGMGHRNTEGTFSSRFRDVVIEMSTSYAWTVTDLQLGRRDVHPFPLGGTIAVEATITHSSSRPAGDRDMTRSTSFTVTFDGTQYATVTLADGTVFYIDLTQGRPLRHRP